MTRNKLKKKNYIMNKDELKEAAKSKLPKAEIKLTIHDDSNVVSPYCEPGKPVISGELADYLENVASNYLPAQPITITFFSDCIDDKEKTTYDKAVRNYFTFKAAEARREITQNTIVSLIFTIIGVISLTVMFILSAHGLGEVLTECLDIFAWVFLWEAVDQFFIERRALVRKCRRFDNFVNADIAFEEINDCL